MTDTAPEYISNEVGCIDARECLCAIGQTNAHIRNKSCERERDPERRSSYVGEAKKKMAQMLTEYDECRLSC